MDEDYYPSTTPPESSDDGWITEIDEFESEVSSSDNNEEDANDEEAKQEELPPEDRSKEEVANESASSSLSSIDRMEDLCGDHYFEEGLDSIDSLDEKRQDELVKKANKTRYKESCACKDKCHDWHRLEDRERWAFKDKLFTYTDEPDNEIYTRAEVDKTFIQGDDPDAALYYTKIVEKVATEHVFLDMIKGNLQ